jgi:hypothetical protein
VPRGKKKAPSEGGANPESPCGRWDAGGGTRTPDTRIMIPIGRVLSRSVLFQETGVLVVPQWFAGLSRFVPFRPVFLR